MPSGNLTSCCAFQMVVNQRMVAEKVDGLTPEDTIVEIVDWAEAGAAAVKAKQGAEYRLGVVIGLVVGIGLRSSSKYLDPA